MFFSRLLAFSFFVVFVLLICLCLFGLLYYVVLLFLFLYRLYIFFQVLGWLCSIVRGLIVCLMILMMKCLHLKLMKGLLDVENLNCFIHLFSFFLFLVSKFSFCRKLLFYYCLAYHYIYRLKRFQFPMFYLNLLCY